MKASHVLLFFCSLFMSLFLQAQPVGDCKLSRSLEMTVIEEPEDQLYKGDEIPLDHLPRTVYWCDGEYLPDGLDAISYFLRDRSRTGDVMRIDPVLLDVLHEILEDINYKGAIMIVSAYRTSKTQKRLRDSGFYAASRNSTHSRGIALDFYIPSHMELGRRGNCTGCRQQLYQAALRALERRQFGGLGAYCGPALHVDVRKGIPRHAGDRRSIVRRWGNQMNILEGTRNPNNKEFMLGMPMSCM